ncbi:MAG: phosphotransferase, partial [Alphaproteobacteria bacterium]|nr:phosphotransferase [Alphaproteobacteria bacterium]
GPEGRRWRLLRWLDGEIHHSAPSAAHAHSAAGLLARFHDVLLAAGAGDWLPHGPFHDTDRYMRLLAAIGIHGDDEIRCTGRAILAAWQDWRVRTPGPLPPARPGHGDLKFSNFLFRAGGAEAVAIIDFDTLARYRLDDEIGDALRSWCNVAAEDTARPTLDEEVFGAAVAGYLGASRSASDGEVAWFVHGMGRIALELAARFCADAQIGGYFAWDPAVAPDARSHNLLRAAGQLHLARQVAERQAELEAIVAASRGG